MPRAASTPSEPALQQPRALRLPARARRAPRHPARHALLAAARRPFQPCGLCSPAPCLALAPAGHGHVASVDPRASCRVFRHPRAAPSATSAPPHGIPRAALRQLRAARSGTSAPRVPAAPPRGPAPLHRVFQHLCAARSSTVRRTGAYWARSRRRRRPRASRRSKCHRCTNTRTPRRPDAQTPRRATHVHFAVIVTRGTAARNPYKVIFGYSENEDGALPEGPERAQRAQRALAAVRWNWRSQFSGAASESHKAAAPKEEPKGGSVAAKSGSSGRRRRADLAACRKPRARTCRSLARGPSFFNEGSGREGA